MAGGQLLHVVALAMVLYAAAVEGGCRTVVRLIGPSAIDGAGTCARDLLDADTWRLAVTQWRQRSSGRGLDADGPGLL